MDPMLLSAAGTFARHYFNKFKKPLIIAASAAALFGAGYATGWTAHAQRTADRQTEQAEQAIQTVVKEVVRRDEVERRVYVQDLATVRKLEAERDRLRAENAELQDRIDLYVPENPGPTGGNLPVGLVRLLDHSARPNGPGAASPAPAALTDEALSASDVEWRDLARYTVRIQGIYNDAALQCNALIDWVDANVVNKSAAQ